MEVTRSVEIANKYGLHARTSTQLSQVARKFSASIRVSRAEKAKGSDEVDAKSILGLLTLGVARGHKLQIRAVGDDAEEAVMAVVDLIENKFVEQDRAEDERRAAEEAEDSPGGASAAPPWS